MIQTASDYDHYALFARYIHVLTEHGPELRGLCPFHDDSTPSWTGNRHTGLWCCFGCGAQGNAYQFAERVGERLEMGNGQQQSKIVSAYDYENEAGNLLYQVLRFKPKAFAQRRPDGNGGYLWNLNGIRRVLYRLPEVLKAKTIFIVEGEKDADRLRSLGFVATCNPEGAGKWREEYSQCLAGKKGVILPDNDEAGEQHTQTVARSLLPIAEAIKIVRLPGLPPKGDVSHWLDAGHTKEELAEIVKNTPILRAEDLNGTQTDTASGTTQQTLQWYTIAQLREETSAEIEYLVDGMLAESSLSLIGGKIAVGKSTLARTLARCVMPGGPPFLGCTTKHGAVLYVAPEESRHGVMKDLEALGFTDADPLHLCFASSPDVLEQVLAKMQETQARLVIFETIFRVLKIKDVNDYAQSTAKLDPVLALARQTSAHVLFTHHLGKRDTTDALDALLGSTAIGGTPDTRIILKRKGDMRTIEVIQRYGQPVPETVLEFDPETKFVRIGCPKAEHDESLVREAILECLKAQEEDQEKGHPLTETEINEEVEGRNAHKRKALRTLVKDGQVERIGKGGKKDPFRYCLKDSCFVVPEYMRGQGDKNQKTTQVSKKTKVILVPAILMIATILQKPGDKNPRGGRTSYERRADPSCAMPRTGR